MAAPDFSAPAASSPGGGTPSGYYPTPGVSSVPSGYYDPSDFQGTSKKKKKKDDGGGFFGSIGKIASDVGSGIVHTTEDFGTGLAHGAIATHEALAAADPSNPRHLGHSDRAALKALGKAQLAATETAFTHPLRDPLNTALTWGAIASLGAGTGLRVAGGLKAAEAARAGEIAASPRAALAKGILRSPSEAPRTLTLPHPEGGPALVTKGRYGRGSLGHVVSKGVDKALEAAAAARAEGSTSRVAKLGETRAIKRVAHWDAKTDRIEQAKLGQLGSNLQAVANKLGLDDAQQRALRIVGETTPYETVLQAQRDRLGESLDLRAGVRDAKAAGEKVPRKTVKLADDLVDNHTERLKWIEDAGQYLDNGPDGRPVLKADSGLQPAYDALDAAAGHRQDLLKEIGLLDDEMVQAVHDKVAKIAAGGSMVRPQDAARMAQEAGQAGRAAADVIESGGAAKVRETERRMVSNAEELRKAESKLFHATTRLTPAEKEARAGIKTAAGEMTKATATKVRSAESAARASDAKGLLIRQGQIVSHLYDGWQKGIVSDGRLARAQTRLQRLTGEYERHAPGESSYRNASAAQTEAMQRMEAHAAELRNREQAANGDLQALRDEHAKAHGRLVGSQYRLTLERNLSRARTQAAQLATQRAVAEALAKAGRIVGADDVTAGERAIHIGDRPAFSRRAQRTFRASSTGTFGHTRDSSLKQLTGAAREKGIESNETTKIVAERHAQAVRLVRLARKVQRLAVRGTKVPGAKDDVFVWTDKLLSSERIPPEVRQFLNDPESIIDKSEEEVRTLQQNVRDAFVHIPENKNWGEGIGAKERERFEELAKEGKGVFVPRKLLGDAGRPMPVRLQGVPKTVVDTVNNIERSLLIYAKPAYPIVQGASNALINLSQQGVLLPRNLAWAVTLGRRVGRENAGLIDSLVGQGFTHQLGFEGEGAISRGSRKLAQAGGLAADVGPRRASWLHEARRAGFDTPDEINKLLHDDQYADELVDVTQRAKEAIVDFDNLTDPEKAYARSLIFVYPWVKGSTVFLGHFLRDHPIQAAALSQAGIVGQRINQETFGDRPSYDEGLLPFFGKAMNTQSLNPLQTPVELGRTINQLATGNPRADRGQAYLNPLVSLAISELTGKDQGGYPLPRGVQGVRQELLGSTPLARVAQALAGKTDERGQLGDLARMVVGTQRTGKSFPGPNDPIWTWILGGLYPRGYSKSGLSSAASYQSSNR